MKNNTRLTSILAVVSINSFMGTFLVSSINLALPTIEHTFGMSAVLLSWIVTAFLLATALFLMPVGSWGDMFGAGKLFKSGVILFTVASVLCAVAPSGPFLIASRFLQGVATALTNTTGQAILVGSFPREKRGSALGISVSSVYLGLTFGPFFGGMLTQHFGWRSIFYVSILLGIVSIVLSFLFIEKDKIAENQSKKMDVKGILFYMAGLSCLVYGSSRIPEFTGWFILLLGLVFVAIFILVETKSDFPMMDIRLFTGNRLFSFSNLAALISYLSTSAIVFFLSLYLQKIHHLNPQHAGFILIAQPIMMSLFSPIVGRLSDKHEPRYFATAGMTLCTTGLAAMAFFSGSTPTWIVVCILLWVGFGFALFSSPNMNMIMSSVDHSKFGQASGSAASMRLLGQIFSMTLVTLLFAVLFSGSSIQTISNTLFLKAMKIGFLCFAAIGVVGIYFSFARGNLRKETI